MKKIIIGIAILLALSACDPESNGPHPGTGPGGPQTNHATAKSTKGNADKKERKPEDEDVPDGQIGLFVTWRSENSQKVACEWSRNGKSTQCDLDDPERESGGYFGYWEELTDAKIGDVFTVSAQGTGAVNRINCEVAWKGQFHEAPAESRTKNRCSISFTVH